MQHTTWQKTRSCEHKLLPVYDVESQRNTNILEREKRYMKTIIQTLMQHNKEDQNKKTKETHVRT